MQECDCCTTAESNTNDDEGADGTDLGAETRAALAASPTDPLDRALPRRVAGPVAEVLGREVDTIGEYLDVLRDVGREWMPPGLDELCRDPDGPHRAVVSGGGAASANVASREIRLVCVLDAFGLPPLLGEPVTVTSAVPGGGTMVLEITDDSVTATREGANEPLDEPVLSFGVAADPDVEVPPEPADVYRSGCPYVHAFPTPERYERWVRASDGETIPLSLSAGVPLAEAILAEY